MRVEAARKAARPAPATTVAPLARSEAAQSLNLPEGRGIIIPPVYGDLKLVISGRDDIVQRMKVVVLFHKWPRTRRNSPLSKNEMRRFQTLTPRLVQTAGNAWQAVIEIAHDGIYEFRVDSGSEQQTDVSCAVKLYDNGGSARTRPVGKRRITHNDVIVKVLMPEGILWDDTSAFSGSLEDSESITKFNTETGLVWKEYR
jgi:hypothetical protein